jgi:leucine-rich repeat protein SHOC2
MEQSALERTIDRARLNQVSTLSLRFSQLTTLPDSLWQLTNLTGLDLSDNQLTILPESLGNLSNLTWLNLDNNYLVYLPKSLGNLANLKQISLYNNRLITLPKNLGNLSNLKRLNLYNNRLTILPSSLSNLTSLEWISLGNNPLTDLSVMQNLTNLRTLNFLDLDLPREYWTSFDEEISHNLLDVNNHKIARHTIETREYIRTTDIRLDREDRQYRSDFLRTRIFVDNLIDLAKSDGRLALFSKNIISLPESICELINLTELNLCDNQLTNLPESIGNLIDLTYLDLSENQLTALPYSIGNLTDLTELDLSNNQLTVLPDSIGDLVNLTELNLSSNLLTNLPESIGNLADLTTLNLAGNPLIDLSIFESNPNLEHIDFLGVLLDRQYWTKLSDWKSDWLLDEENAEVRRVLIEQIGYERICHELNAVTIDTWREYTLLKIDDVEAIYDEDEEPIDREPMVLIKMTCPSTGHIHILRVPPGMLSAEDAIVWVNHDIHPDEFAIQT